MPSSCILAEKTPPEQVEAWLGQEAHCSGICQTAGSSLPEGTTTQQGVKDGGGLEKRSARKRSSGVRLSKQHHHLKAFPPKATAGERLIAMFILTEYTKTAFSIHAT